MTLAVIWGLCCQGILLAWIAFKLSGRAFPCWRAFIAGGVGILSLIPFLDGLSVAMVTRALWGDPSATALLLMVLSLFGRPPAFDRRVVLTLGIFGLIFYPLALGAGNFDPYRIGYAPAPIIALLSMLSTYAWRRGYPIYLWLLAFDLSVYAIGPQESDNFWDILVDPLLVAYAAIAGFAGRNQVTMPAR